MLKKFNNANIKGCKQGFCPGGCLHSFQEFWENYQLEVNSHLQLKNVIKCNINFLKKSANLYYSLPKPFLSILLFLQKFPIFYMYKNKIEFKILILFLFLWLLLKNFCKNMQTYRYIILYLKLFYLFFFFCREVPYILYV